jgi:sulfoxide reductase catalytic subunit YedY
MLIKKHADIRYSEVTPKALYCNRRKLRADISTAFLGVRELLLPAVRTTKPTGLVKSAFSTSEKENSINDVSPYNNYYEFGTQKDEPAEYAKNFKISPWTLSVEGDVAKPRKFRLDKIMKVAPLEERIYCHGCVEGRSMRADLLDYSFWVAAGVLTIVLLATVVPNAPGSIGLANIAASWP